MLLPKQRCVEKMPGMVDRNRALNTKDSTTNQVNQAQTYKLTLESGVDFLFMSSVLRS